MVSNSALKFPLPKLSLPRRWMISKSTSPTQKRNVSLKLKMSPLAIWSPNSRSLAAVRVIVLAEQPT